MDCVVGKKLACFDGGQINIYRVGISGMQQNKDQKK